MKLPYTKTIEDWPNYWPTTVDYINRFQNEQLSGADNQTQIPFNEDQPKEKVYADFPKRG